MTNYEFVEEVSRYTQRKYNIKIKQGRGTDLLAHANSISWNYATSASVRGTYENHVYEFVKWVLESEQSRGNLREYYD